MPAKRSRCSLTPSKAVMCCASEERLGQCLRICAAEGTGSDGRRAPHAEEPPPAPALPFCIRTSWAHPKERKGRKETPSKAGEGDEAKQRRVPRMDPAHLPASPLRGASMRAGQARAGCPAAGREKKREGAVSCGNIYLSMKVGRLDAKTPLPTRFGIVRVRNLSLNHFFPLTTSLKDHSTHTIKTINFCLNRNPTFPSPNHRDDTEMKGFHTSLSTEDSAKPLDLFKTIERRA
ncbi:hypothetical protein Anapl_12216 [Anas platyrhynchos]|uniref:Uncharacterized protein n=1 Tax=Anas platyrhynchos TaxID=8839 RepID=R0JLA5_ANAPL|nr:hypothetical protein Anapl_12216 [Anas platyrhynchos]